MNKSSGICVVVLLVSIIDLWGIHGFLTSSTTVYFPRYKISRPSTLKKQKNDNKDFDKKKEEKDIFYVQEPQLLVCDLFAILIACEILGLFDDLAIDGIQSFMEPITFNSFSTLPLLIKRDSLLSICWILSSLKNGSFYDVAVADEISVIKSVFASFVDFCSLVIIYTLCSSYFSNQVADGNDLLRQVSTSLIILLSFRLMLIRR